MASRVYEYVNRLLGIKGNIIKVKFRMENKVYEVYVPGDEMWGAIKDILLNREYESLHGFELKSLKTAGFQVKYFNPPFMVRNAQPKIKIERFAKLRFLGFVIYSIASLGNLRDKDFGNPFCMEMINDGKSGASADINNNSYT